MTVSCFNAGQTAEIFLPALIDRIFYAQFCHLLTKQPPWFEAVPVWLRHHSASQSESSSHAVFVVHYWRCQRGVFLWSLAILGRVSYPQYSLFLKRHLCTFAKQLHTTNRPFLQKTMQYNTKRNYVSDAGLKINTPECDWLWAGIWSGGFVFAGVAQLPRHVEIR